MPLLGSLETINADHLSSLIDEFDGERDKLLLPEELSDSVTDVVSIGEMGKSSLQAEAMFMLSFSIRFAFRYCPSTSICRQILVSPRRISDLRLI
jgi:hypothetical protein